jgi:hypothetical protein
MPRFRPPYPPGSPGNLGAEPLTPAVVRTVVAELLRPGNFFVGAGLTLEWAPPSAETIAWELFQGRLLEATMTRQRRTFLAWNVFMVGPEGRSAEPVLAVQLDEETGQAHVVRALDCYAWEGYDAGGNVFLSRPKRKWLRELVGTVDARRSGGADEFRDELVCRLFQAVAGTSRLPLTSLEAPLPAFSLGQLAYFYRPGLGAAGDRPQNGWRELVEVARDARLAQAEQAKLLETLLHAVGAGEMAEAAAVLAERFAAPLVSVLLGVFNEVSLSPYTDLVDKALSLLGALEDAGRLSPGETADFLSLLLRMLGRHLTAYDLVKFHHQGANYPDALFLDALLKALLDRARRRPDVFAAAPGDDAAERRRKRRRRRGLRQGWLLRCRYEGHLVPDAPTSQGENQRVLPSEFPRVPEEQILQPMRRTKRLYANDSLREALGDPERALLRQSVLDLRDAEELRELGTALFLDRPLGVAKAPAEPDATPLLSSEAFSLTLAERRLKQVADLGLADPDTIGELRRALAALPVMGLPLREVPARPRPGTVSLADAHLSADDWMLLRTTPRTVRAFLALYDLAPLVGRPALLVTGGDPGDGRPRLRVYDEGMRQRLELAFDPVQGYESRGGVEYPASGLVVEKGEAGTVGRVLRAAGSGSET